MADHLDQILLQKAGLLLKANKEITILKIHNVRLGFAANSSSSHSIVFCDPDQVDELLDSYEFGWNEFVAHSKESKMHYLSLLLYYNLQNIMNSEMANIVMQHLTGIPYTEDSYIDHQSIIDLPFSRDMKGVDTEFYKEFENYILQEDIAILGGNDNYDEEEDISHPLSSNVINLPLGRESSGRYIARKDKTFDYWTLFNVYTGAKVRFSFNDIKESPTKASYPELVDLKITNCCFKNCIYCYQGSTSNGLHAKKSDFYSILSALGDMGVFEVAIGGGEPTIHPNFDYIISSCRYHNIVPNFTTANLDWICNPNNKGIMDEVGAIAYTVNKYEDIENLSSIIDKYGYTRNKFTLQVIVELTEGLFTILQKAYEHHFRVTLLGFKGTGRAKDIIPNKIDWIKSIQTLIKERDCPVIAIDTVLAKEYEKELKKIKIPSHLYETKDGTFSMYIDMVEKKCGPSSYEPDKLVDLKMDKDLFLQLANNFFNF